MQCLLELVKCDILLLVPSLLLKNLKIKSLNRFGRQDRFQRGRVHRRVTSLGIGMAIRAKNDLREVLSYGTAQSSHRI